jgi:hypothetical protein
LVFYDRQGEGVAIDMQVLVYEVDAVLCGHVAEKVEGAIYISYEYRRIHYMMDLRVERANGVVFIADEV